MKLKVKNYIELIDAIYKSNFTPSIAYEVELGGTSADYIVRQPTAHSFGAVGFPVITGQISLNGHGVTIARSPDAPPFRLFMVDAKYTGHVGRLTLNQVNLSGGYSTVDGGGALLNDGTVTLNNCVIQDNTATKGGAIYNGDGRALIIDGCTFTNNIGLLRGAAIYNSSFAHLTVTNTTFTGNRADREPFVDIYVVSQLVSPIALTDSAPTLSMNQVALTADQVDFTNRLKPFSDTFVVVEDENEDEFEG